MDHEDAVGFSADQPIQAASGDLLNRAGYAKNLASRIADWPGDTSLVVGLTGEWGCGKTSLKNLILECLRSRDEISILEFSPWEYAQHRLLSEAFFKELEKMLRRDGAEKSKDAGIRLRLYAEILGIGGMILKTAGGAAAFNGSPVGGIAMASGAVLESAAEIARSGANITDSKSEKALSVAKAELAEAMAALDQSFVVVIDDIDRLTSDEIREVFQMVKSNGNLPHLVYLLLYDRKVVSKALDQVVDGDGDRYLEKIVQVSLPIPQPSHSEIHNVLFNRLDAYLANEEVGKLWDKGRWTSCWLGGLNTYFNSLRAVYRFLGSFEFHAGLLTSGRTPEVNPLDLIMIEVFRVFEPDLYQILPRYQSELLDGGGSRSTHQSEQIERATKSILATVDSPRKEQVSRLLGVVFPAFGRFDDSHSRARTRRVGSKDYFDRYFAVGLGKSELSEVTIESLRKSIPDAKQLRVICETLCKEGRLQTAFERLDVFNGEIPADQLEDSIIALIGVADLDDGNDIDSLFRFDLCTLAWRQVFFSLKKLEDEENRYRVLRSAIQAGDGLLLVVRIAGHELRDREKNVEYLVSEEQAEELKAIALEKIHKFASNGGLRKLKRAGYVFYRWSEFESVEAVRAWLDDQMKDPSDALWILRQFLLTMSSTSNVTVYTRYIRLDQLEHFVTLDHVVEQTRDLDITDLSQDDMRALRAFRCAIRWRGEGKPVEYIGPDSKDENPLCESE